MLVARAPLTRRNLDASIAHDIVWKQPKVLPAFGRFLPHLIGTASLRACETSRPARGKTSLMQTLNWTVAMIVWLPISAVLLRGLVARIFETG